MLACALKAVITVGSRRIQILGLHNIALCVSSYSFVSVSPSVKALFKQPFVIFCHRPESGSSIKEVKLLVILIALFQRQNELQTQVWLKLTEPVSKNWIFTVVIFFRALLVWSQITYFVLLIRGFLLITRLHSRFFNQQILRLFWHSSFLISSICHISELLVPLNHTFRAFRDFLLGFIWFLFFLGLTLLCRWFFILNGTRLVLNHIIVSFILKILL